ncbi:putative 5'-nucleotidase [Dioscorea sansibarensis]
MESMLPVSSSSSRLLSSPAATVCSSARRLHQSGVGHGITWHHAISAKPVNIDGATAFAVAGIPADCASLGNSGEFFNGITPDLVLSGINTGSNCGYDMDLSERNRRSPSKFLGHRPALVYQLRVMRLRLCILRE